jgi:preprotein translocase subunit SecG
MIQILLTVIHLVVSLVLILVVLLQTGKRADLAGAFGGGGSQTAFGARGAATLLSKATTICAVLFMMTSLGLSIVSSHRQDRGTVLDEIPAGAPTTAPVTPGGGTPTDPTAGESVPQTPDSPVDTSGGTEPQ